MREAALAEAAGRNVLTAAGTIRLKRLDLTCPRCRVAALQLDARLGVAGFVSRPAQRMLCLAEASWSFDRAAANLKEFCGSTVCDNTIRQVCQGHGGGAMRDGQRDDPAAAVRAAGS